MQNRRYDVWWFLLAFLLLCMVPDAHCTTVMGQAKLAGVPFNGYLDVALAYPSTTGTYIALPGNSSGGHQTVTNGYFEAMNLEGNDTLLPAGTYYTFTYSDVYGSAVARLNFVITGANFDIGAAVPTPVTTNNINFLDLLGIRNFSASNVTINNQIQIGSNGAIFGTNGLSNAKTVDDIQYATGYLTGSTTCGVMEAMAALPSTGGTVVLPVGSCTISTTITINKSVRLIGHDRGGTTNTAATTFSAGSTLVNGGTGGAIVVQSVGSTVLSGVGLSDFMITGGGSDGIYVVGTAAAAVANMSVDRVVVANPATYGFHLQDNVTGVNVTNSSFVGSTHPIYLNSSGAGSPDRVTIVNSQASLGSSNGMEVDSAQAVTVTGSSFLNNTGSGLFLSSTTGSLRAYGSVFGNNTVAGVNIVQGAGHVIDGCTFLVGTRQQYGLLANYAGSSTLTQVTLLNSTLTAHLTDDIYLGASMTRALVYPETYAFTDGSVHNVFGPGVIFVATSATPTTSVVARTCNSNGCYRQEADGTYTMWGNVAGCGASPNCAVSITFPTSFTTTSGLSVQDSCVTATPTGANCIAGVTNTSTTGFQAQIGAGVFVGGSGLALSGESINWFAIGN